MDALRTNKASVLECFKLVRFVIAAFLGIVVGVVAVGTVVGALVSAVALLFTQESFAAEWSQLGIIVAIVAGCMSFVVCVVLGIVVLMGELLTGTGPDAYKDQRKVR